MIIISRRKDSPSCSDWPHHHRLRQIQVESWLIPWLQKETVRWYEFTKSAGRPVKPRAEGGTPIMAGGLSRRRFPAMPLSGAEQQVGVSFEQEDGDTQGGRASWCAIGAHAGAARHAPRGRLSYTT